MKQKLVTIVLTVTAFGWILAGQAAAQEGMSNISMPPIVNEQPTPLPIPQPGRPVRPVEPVKPRMPMSIAGGIRMLAYLEGKISGLEKEAADLKEKISNLEMSKIEESIKQKGLATLRAELARVEHKIGVLEARQDKVKAGVMNKMHHLYKQTSDKIAGLDDKIAHLKEKGAAIREEIAKVEASDMSDEAKAAKIKELEAKLAWGKEKIATLEVEKAGLGKRLEVLEALGKAVAGGNYELALHMLMDLGKDFPTIKPGKDLYIVENTTQTTLPNGTTVTSVTQKVYNRDKTLLSTTTSETYKNPDGSTGTHRVSEVYRYDTDGSGRVAGVTIKESWDGFFPDEAGNLVEKHTITEHQVIIDPVAPEPGPVDPVRPGPVDPIIGPAPEKPPVIGPVPGDVVIAPNGKSLQTNDYHEMSVGVSSSRRGR